MPGKPADSQLSDQSILASKLSEEPRSRAATPAATAWSPFTHTSATLTILLLLLVLGPGAGIIAHEMRADLERREALVEFEERLLVQVSLVREETLAIVEALHSLRAFFDSSEIVTREEFAIFTSDMRERRPTIQAAEWIPKVTPEGRGAHVATARAEGFPDYEIREMAGDGVLGPVGVRDAYFPVFYVEPLRPNERVLGFDLGSEAVRGKALARATRTGTVALSDPVSLVQEEDCPGVLAVLPIHGKRGFASPGFVLIVFRIEDLVRRSVLSGPGAKPTWMQVSLVDENVDSRSQVLYRSDRFREDHELGVRCSAMDIAVGGQVWSLCGHPTDEFLDSRRTGQPLLLGVTVFLIWEAFFGLLFLLVKWSRDRARLEQSRSDETVQRLSGALEQTADAVFITDREGTIEYVNPAFESMFGYAHGEALGENPRILKSGEHGKDYYDSLWDTLQAGNVFRASTVNRMKSGELVHVEQTITPMRNPTGLFTHYVSVCKDMTEKRKSEEQDAELRIAAAVQKRLYPAGAPRVEGLDLAGAVFSADATCGDYFDYIPCSDGRMAIAIGDVSGHGLGPALLMAETRAYLRPLVNGHEDLGSAFGSLHRSISDDLGNNRFVTLLAAKFSDDGAGLSYANAGHTPGYVLDADGKVKVEMCPTGPAIGIFDEAIYTTSPRIDLDAGDLVLLLTDGVTESRAPDGSFFEDEGALEVVRAHRNESASEIVTHLYEAARAFDRDEKQSDDITIVVVKVDSA